jgi:hypothetical protein
VRNAFTPAIVYVMLSRATQRGNVGVLGELPPAHCVPVNEAAFELWVRAGARGTAAKLWWPAGRPSCVCVEVGAADATGGERRAWPKGAGDSRRLGCISCPPPD